MKRLILAFFIFSSLCLSAQQPDWLQRVTLEAGLDSAIGTRIVLADVNGDNYPDLLWGTGALIKNHYKLYLNIPNPDKSSGLKRVFIDFTDSSGINYNRRTGQNERIIDVASLVDVDNDNDLDLVTSIYYHRLQMYQGANDPGDRSEVMLNDGKGHFTLVNNNGLNTLKLVDSLASGLVNATGMAFLDYDLDGKLDMYMSTWFSDYAANLAGLGAYIMPDALLKGNGDGTFTHVKNSGIENVVFPMYGVNVTDWNNDGLPDILTSPYCRSGGSLFMNTGNGAFIDVAYNMGYTSQKIGGDHGQDLCQWESQPADFDNDGDMDLLQVEVHGGYNKGEGRTHITINKGKDENYMLEWDLDRLKRDAPVESHIGDQGGQWWDINNDGLQDVAIGQMGYPDANLEGQERLYLLMQDSLHRFADVSKELGVYKFKEAHSMEPADYDLDGDLDLFFSRQIRDTITTHDTVIYKTYMHIELLQNNFANSQNWTAVKLIPVGGKTNMGTRITVCSGDLKQMQELQAGLGHTAGQQPFIRHFGLGSRNRVDSVIIEYPGFEQRQVFFNPPINIVHIAGTQNYVKAWDDAQPVIHFSSAYTKFDTVNAGSQSTKKFLINNIGEKKLTIKSIKSSSSVFTITNTSVTEIPPGQFAEIEVTFKPVKRYTYREYIEIESDAVNGSIRRYDLLGAGFAKAPILTLSSDTVDFGDVWYDTAAAARKIRIQNTGELELEVESVSFDNANIFSGSANLPLAIVSGAFADIDVFFDPDTLGAFNGKLIINSNHYDGPRTVYLTGKSTGPAPVINISATSLLFGSRSIGETIERKETISNYGNAPLTVSNVSFTEKTAFKIIEDILPIVIEPNASYVLSVFFTPMEARSYNSSMTITSNSITEPVVTVALSASGKPVSVEESRESSILVYPVPAAEEIFIETGSEYYNSTITLMDNMGRQINSVKTNSENIAKFDVSQLDSGSYIIIIKTGKETIHRQVVVVK